MPIEAHFGESPALSIGVEEEVMILDGESFEPVPAVRQLLADAEQEDLPGRMKTELHASVVELNTDVCSTPEEAVVAIADLRAKAAELLERRGLRLAAAGSHPFAEPEELEIVDEERYREMVDYAGIIARRQGVNGIHVHLGMPGADECVSTLEAILPWLPVVLAASANSPYLRGQAIGVASNRALVLGQLPRSGAPPPFRSYAAWEEWVERFVATGVAQDYTQLWWDVRPHPRFGTLEIRMPDQPTSIQVTRAIVALLRDLCEWGLAHPRAEPADRGIYAQNRWAAARFGVAGELIHPDGDRLVPVRELFAELPGSPGLWPSEAEHQLEIGETRGVKAVAADLVERTVRFP